MFSKLLATAIEVEKNNLVLNSYLYLESSLIFLDI